MIQNKENITTYKTTKKRAKKFDILFEEMTEALFLHNWKGDIIKVNRKACEYLGLKKSVLETMNVNDFISADVMHSFKMELKKQTKKEQYSLETNYVKKGNKIPVEIKSRPIMLGKTRMILTGFRDISIRKNYENQLVESRLQAQANENELNAIFNNSPSSIFAFDENMNILRANNKAITDFSINELEIKNQKIGDLIQCTKAQCNLLKCTSTTACKLVTIFNETITKDKTFNKVEVQVSTKTGDSVSNKTMLVSTSALKRNGHSVFIATLDDITERKELELELIAAKEKAEEADRLKSSFIQNLHHEIRTPLNGILGFIDFLVDDSYDFSIHEKRELSDVMHKSSDRLIKTIDDLLEISKLDCGILKVNNELFDLKSHLDHVVKEELLKYNNPSIEFRYEIDAGLKSKTVSTDKTKLSKIIKNVLDNAFKFTSKGYIKFKVHLQNEDLYIVIEDSGIGIDAKFHELIFNPFWQLEKDLDRYYEGNGLGLAVSKKTVSSLGGEISVKSDLGRGATFTIKLPKILEEGVQQTVITESIVNNKVSLMGKTILICEDDRTNSIYIETILSKEECKLIHVANGLEAVEECRKNTTIDLVLMDLKMPQMDGFEASAKITELRPNIPIIAQSAFALTSEKDRALKAGCIDYLTKPINRNQLISTIIKYLNKNR